MANHRRELDADLSDSRDGTRFVSGATVRAARVRAGIGVRELARRIDCSPGLISRIEGGTVSPSVQNLYAIAKELDTSVDVLLNPLGATPSSASTDNAPAFEVMRANGKRPISLPNGVQWRLLAGGSGAAEFREVRYEPGAMSGPPGRLLRHEGHEYGYMVDGQLLLQINDELVELDVGDSVSLPAQAPHRLSNVSDLLARAVWLITGPASR